MAEPGIHMTHMHHHESVVRVYVIFSYRWFQFFQSGHLLNPLKF